MEEIKKKEIPLMSLEEFKDYLISNGRKNVSKEYEEKLQEALDINNQLNLLSYNYNNKYKSIRRAIRRGHLTVTGIIVPKRPFNNRKHTIGRGINIRKKEIYGALKNKQRGIQ
jgi:hypothetical protein